MHILQLVNEGLAGGVLRVAIELTINLNLIGAKAIIHSSVIPHVYNGFLYPQVRIYRKIKTPNLSPFLENYINPILKETLTALIPKVPSDFNADWIICHNLSPIYDALKLRDIWNSKIAVMIHNPTFPPPAFRFMTHIHSLRSLMHKKAQFLLKKSDLVIATSKKTKELIRQLYGLDSVVLYPGCNPLPKLPPYRDDFILCAQRLSLGKRIQDVAEAIALVDKNAKVVFAGSIHSTTGIAIKKIRASGLKNYRIIPNIAEYELRKLYASCRFFVSVIGEPFGMNQIESASCGAPMICNAKSGASELFRHRIHGYFCKDSNAHPSIDEYARYIERLLNDERKAWRMGCAAWNLCRKEYTWKCRVKRLLSLLGSKVTAISPSA